MAINYDEIEIPSKYMFLPKVGEEATFEIVEVSQMQHEKFDIVYNKEEIIDGKTLTSKESMGFYLGCTLKNGKVLVVNSVSGLRLFSDNKIVGGQKICVKHPSRGKWSIDILEELA